MKLYLIFYLYVLSSLSLVIESYSQAASVYLREIDSYSHKVVDFNKEFVLLVDDNESVYAVNLVNSTSSKVHDAIVTGVQFEVGYTHPFGVSFMTSDNKLYNWSSGLTELSSRIANSSREADPRSFEVNGKYGLWSEWIYDDRPSLKLVNFESLQITHITDQAGTGWYNSVTKAGVVYFEKDSPVMDLFKWENGLIEALEFGSQASRVKSSDNLLLFNFLDDDDKFRVYKFIDKGVKELVTERAADPPNYNPPINRVVSGHYALVYKEVEGIDQLHLYDTNGTFIQVSKTSTSPQILSLSSIGEGFFSTEEKSYFFSKSETIDLGIKVDFATCINDIEWRVSVGNTIYLFSQVGFGLDSDGDGLSNYDEFHIYNTSLDNNDTDADGLSDKLEVTIGSNPNWSDAAVVTYFQSLKTFEEGVAEGRAETVDEIVKIVTKVASASGLDVTDSIESYTYSDFIDEIGSIDLDEIELIVGQFIDYADTELSPYTNGWFYSRKQGWMWTSKQAYPYFYINEKGWLYFKNGHDLPRFFNYETKEWFDVED
jgi:hypothetical protein